MNDREKVINKVKAIVADMQEEVDEWKDYSDSELRGGLTCDCDWWYKTLQTLKDALALLRHEVSAQEPRVMPLDEYKVIAERPAEERVPVWMEWRGGSGRWTIPARAYMLYDVTWRCWTSRPDEKRRAETPWN